MTIFNIEITNESHLAGITAARVAYNDLLEETIIDENGDTLSNPNVILTDWEYVQYVMSKAAESYSNQYNT